ncbi:hypothetical protein [Chroococcidiopsis sp. CCMEE 29]|uniref:hypothetical protein n=1 Tax=Chroococcidiopsis sp. CCMEE 29 TaxID=155894 RepID=UPI0020224876|nr:hypothetical protein [Chroococcidiopsis sp. CCMEE 29]
MPSRRYQTECVELRSCLRHRLQECIRWSAIAFVCHSERAIACTDVPNKVRSPSQVYKVLHSAVASD